MNNRGSRLRGHVDDEVKKHNAAENSYLRIT